MKKIIEEPLALIAGLVLGTGSGFGLSAFIAATEIRQWLIPIAIAFSLMVSLMISAYYKANKSRLSKSRFWKYSIKGAAIFLIMLVLFFISYSSFETRLNVRDNNDMVKTDSVFIGGIYYTTMAKNEINQIIKENPANENYLQLVFNDSGGRDLKNIWSNTSRMFAKLIILLCYIFFIASLVGTITITTEIINTEGRAGKNANAGKSKTEQPVTRTSRIEELDAQEKLLLEKKADFERSKIITADPGKEFQLKKEIEKIDEELKNIANEKTKYNGG